MNDMLVTEPCYCGDCAIVPIVLLWRGVKVNPCLLCRQQRDNLGR